MRSMAQRDGVVTVRNWLRRWRWGIVGLVVVAAAPLAEQWLPVAIGAVVVALGSVLFDLLWQRMREERGRQPDAGAQVLVARVRDLDDPLDLGVDPAPALVVNGRAGTVPPYVERDVTQQFRERLRDSGFVLLTGDSTAGLTREAYEGIRAVLPRHRLIKPERAVDLDAALRLAERESRCVLWLDDLEQFIGGLDRMTLRRLVDRKGRHVVVLATMASVFLEPRGQAGWENPLADLVRHTREVLDLAEVVPMERMWSDAELRRAEALRHDARIDAALADADDYGVAQHLAAGHLLVRRWRSGRAEVTAGGHPLGVAIVDAVVDARRYGYHEPIGEELLREISQPYLVRRFGNHQRTETWAEALAWATHVDERVSGSSMVLRREDGYRAFTYLVGVEDEFQHRRMPEQVWRTLLDHGDADGASAMGVAAFGLGDMHRGVEGLRRAADGGDPTSIIMMGAFLGRRGDDDKAREWLVAEIAEAERDLGPDHEDTLLLQVLQAVYEHLDDPPHAAARLGELLAGTALGTREDLFEIRLTFAMMRARLLLDSGDAGAAAELAGECVRECQERDVDPVSQVSCELAHISMLGRAGRWRTAADLAIQLTGRCTVEFGLLAPITLMARQWCGHALLHTGDRAAALGRLTSALEDCLNVLGPRDRVTLGTRMAYVEAVELTEPARARELWRILVADAAEILGADDLQTVEIRMHQITVLRRLGEWAQLLELSRELVAEQVAVHGERSFRTLELRRQYAEDLGGAGEAEAALALWEELVPEFEQHLGGQDRRTLRARGHRIDQLGGTGRPALAARLASELAGDVERLLPAGDYLQVESVGRAARLLAAAGNHPAAAARYAELVDLYESWYGEREPATLNARFHHSVQFGLSGQAVDAAAGLAELLPLFTELRGADHDEVWAVRQEHARWVAGYDAAAGAALYEQIAADRGDVFDPQDRVQFDCRIKAAEAWFQAGEQDRAFAILNAMRPYVRIEIEPDDGAEPGGEG